MNNEKLIGLVRQYSVLYDLTHPKYMHSMYKLAIWNKIAKEMQMDMSVCKTRWNNIRDNYRKSMRKNTTKNGQSTKKIKLYKYSDQLGFLTRHIGEKEAKGNIESQENEDEKDEEEENERNGAEESNVSDSSDVPANTRKITSKRMTYQHTPSSKLIEYLIKKNGNQATASKSQHPVDAFLAGVAPTLKTLNPYYLNLAKSEIFATVQKYEMKMLTEQHSYQERSTENFPLKVEVDAIHYSSTPSPVSTPLLSPTETATNGEHRTFRDNCQILAHSTET